MMESVAAFCDLADSKETGTSLGSQIKKSMNGQSPDVAIVFASSRYNYAELLEALNAACEPKHIVGCSSAGEFINGTKGEGAASVMALRSSDMLMSSSLGRGLRQNRQEAAENIAHSFVGEKNPQYPYRSVLLLADALAGHTDDLIEQLTILTSGAYQFFGGGAGDDAKFNKTHVFFGTEAVNDACVSLEILSKSPLGIGVQHGWQASGPLMRVTEANGMNLVSLNSIPAVEVIEEYARTTNQNFDRKNPLPFFLHNTLGLQTMNGFKLRVPLSVEADGSINCASNIPTGVMLTMMTTTSRSAADAAERAVQSALGQLGGRSPQAALFFDCVATRLRLGKDFSNELESVTRSLGANTTFAGCNTYGQIARAEGQFSGFHNCTAVVCVFPEA